MIWLIRLLQLEKIIPEFEESRDRNIFDIVSEVDILVQLSFIQSFSTRVIRTEGISCGTHMPDGSIRQHLTHSF